MWTVATFNVKDLFVPEAAASPALQELWQAKLADVAARIARSGADVVSLQEVGGQAGLDALLAVLGAPWVGSCAPGNSRGIANAMVSKLPFRTVVHHHATGLPFPTFVVDDPAPFGARLSLSRALVEATFDTELGVVHVFCIHLKSNLPQAQKAIDGSWLPEANGRARGESHIRSLVVRAAEALYVRSLVDVACTQSPYVIVGGDFNDVPGSIPLRVVAAESRDPAHVELQSASNWMPQHKRYTALFRGRTQTLDHLLMTPALAERITGADADLQGLRDHGPFDPDAPPTIDSDHALILARFTAA